MSNNIEIVKSMIDAFCRNDKEGILGLFAEDAVFDNIPIGPVQGHDAIWEFLQPIHSKATDIHWEIHNIAEATNGFVLTERTDRYKVNDQWATFPVMGIFEIEDGKVKHWRDYFDLNQCMATIDLS